MLTVGVVIMVRVRVRVRVRIYVWVNVKDGGFKRTMQWWHGRGKRRGKGRRGTNEKPRMLLPTCEKRVNEVVR